MALPTGPANSGVQGTDIPSRLFETGRNDYELYEEDDEFVLSVEMPGFDPEGITASWDDGVLNVVAEHEDDQRGERKTYHRRFRFPKNVDDEGITAQYTNGILEVATGDDGRDRPWQGDRNPVLTQTASPRLGDIDCRSNFFVLERGDYHAAHGQTAQEP